MALFSANAFSLHKAAVTATVAHHNAKFSPLRMAVPCSSSSKSTLLASPKLSTGNTPTFRFASPFFADPGFLKLKREISEIKCEGNSHRGGASLCTGSFVLSRETIRWIFAGASLLLMLLKSTPLNKSFLVPLLGLQAPRDVITWIRGDYGIWAAFLALLVRLFYYIPGELELPLIFVLIVITAPYQVMDFRESTGALICCAAVAGYLAYQHFSRTGLQGAFKEGTFLASLSVICLVVVPLIFIFGGF